MEITVLVENTCKNAHFGTEHGLSLLIRTEQHTILFDMGQTDLFLENANKMGIDLTSVDFAVLSHGHYDHGGGLEYFLKINQKAFVYVNVNGFGSYYNAKDSYIGLDASLKNNPRVIKISDSYEIAKGITIHSCVGKKENHIFDSFGLKKSDGLQITEDDFCHEQYLRVEEKGKVFIFSGCAHKGILNIMDWFHPDVFIGGFHFSKISDTTLLDRYVSFLSQYNADYYTCHCTGEEQFMYMQQNMKNLFYLSCGETIML